ncbi:MAG: glutathione S-transferase [Burkholderiales bacterium]
MKLFFNSASPYVRKVRVFAREAGLDKKIEEVSTMVSPVQENPALAEANPLKKIPALVLDDGSTLFDSPVICEYLDSLHTGRKLFPATGAARWTALRLQATGDGILDAGILCRYEMAVRPKEFQWAGWVDGQKSKWHGGLDLLEREASALDGEPTIGNITVACALGWLDFRYGDDDWRKNRTKLTSWYEKFLTRGSMQATMPSA